MAAEQSPVQDLAITLSANFDNQVNDLVCQYSPVVIASLIRITQAICNKKSTVNKHRIINIVFDDCNTKLQTTVCNKLVEVANNGLCSYSGFKVNHSYVNNNEYALNLVI